MSLSFLIQDRCGRSGMYERSMKRSQTMIRFFAREECPLEKVIEVSSPLPDGNIGHSFRGKWEVIFDHFGCQVVLIGKQPA